MPWWSSAAGRARWTGSASTLDGPATRTCSTASPCGVLSVSCALDDVGTASIDTLLQRFASYRVVHLPTVGQLVAARFDLLPSFRRPHFTVRLEDDGER